MRCAHSSDEKRLWMRNAQGALLYIGIKCWERSSILVSLLRRRLRNMLLVEITVILMLNQQGCFAIVLLANVPLIRSITLCDSAAVICCTYVSFSSALRVGVFRFYDYVDLENYSSICRKLNRLSVLFC
mmetsp:Transcript_10847/g.21575  ORF Transcript_10847/g.21575 Transcript_10847/m.21575 type:complete len:129 (-) Transcript_10847:104-490(-)